MIDFRTVKAKECCCGCTLRTGSLILFWINLISSCIATLYYLTDVAYGSRVVRYSYENRPDTTYMKIRSSYYLACSIVGMITSLLGIFGIQKNVPKHLTFSLYYLGYYVLHFSLSMVAVSFFSKTFVTYMLGGENFATVISESGEFIFVAIILYLFSIALMLYFMLIIKSCRDSMMKNLTSSKANQNQHSVAFGYNASY